MPPAVAVLAVALGRLSAPGPSLELRTLGDVPEAEGDRDPLKAAELAMAALARMTVSGGVRLQLRSGMKISARICTASPGHMRLARSMVFTSVPYLSAIDESVSVGFTACTTTDVSGVSSYACSSAGDCASSLLVDEPGRCDDRGDGVVARGCFFAVALDIEPIAPGPFALDAERLRPLLSMLAPL